MRPGTTSAHATRQESRAAAGEANPVTASAARHGDRQETSGDRNHRRKLTRVSSARNMDTVKLTPPPMPKHTTPVRNPRVHQRLNRKRVSREAEVRLKRSPTMPRWARRRGRRSAERADHRRRSPQPIQVDRRPVNAEATGVTCRLAARPVLQDDQTARMRERREKATESSRCPAASTLPCGSTLNASTAGYFNNEPSIASIATSARPRACSCSASAVRQDSLSNPDGLLMKASN
jgi:hypothetical protein